MSNLALPPLDERGLLPPGVHLCNLEDVSARFGATPRRRKLLEGLVRWTRGEMRWCVGIEAIVLAGSFVTNKPDPDDLDVAVVLDKGSQTGIGLERKLVKDRRRLWTQYRLDVFPGAGGFFQFLGDKGAQRHGGRPVDLHGVVSLAGWHRETERTLDAARMASWMTGRTHLPI